jgi:hypothetical protein
MRMSSRRFVFTSRQRGDCTFEAFGKRKATSEQTAHTAKPVTQVLRHEPLHIGPEHEDEFKKSTVISYHDLTQ